MEMQSVATNSNVKTAILGRKTNSKASGRSVERPHEIFFDTNESEMVVTQTNPIRHFESFDGFERRPVYEHQRVAGSDLVAAFKQYNEHEPNVVKLITADHDVITVEPTGDECSLCDDNETPEIERGMPAKAAQSERARANCAHAAVASNLPFVEQCDCGSLEVEQHGPATKRMSPIDKCASCETTL